jgi:hypothetical protein
MDASGRVELYDLIRQEPGQLLYCKAPAQNTIKHDLCGDLVHGVLPSAWCDWMMAQDQALRGSRSWNLVLSR